MGSKLKLIDRQTIDLTIEKAEWLLGNGEEVQEFSGDRPLKSAHVDNLVHAMKRGTFHPEWVTLILCKYEGKLYRMNGQHTAWARTEMHKHWSCRVELLTYEAMTEEDMRQLYASIDRSSPRTRRNIIESYLKGTPEFDGVKAVTLKIVPQGYSLFRWELSHERKRHDGDDVAYMIKTEHYDLAKKVCDFLDTLSPKEHPFIFRASVVAAMFASFQKAPKIATDFWRLVADGTGFERKGDPRLKLRNELMQNAVGLGGGALTTKKKMTQEAMCRMCIRAWNAYRDDKPVQILRPGPAAGKRPAAK